MIKKLLGLVRGCLVIIGLLVVLALVFGGGSDESSRKDVDESKETQEQVQSEEEKSEKSDGREDKDAAETESKSESEPKSEAKEGGASRPETEISDDFKAAMDSYEAFFDEYVDFMKRYQENPDDMSLLMEASEMMMREADMLEEFDAWEEEEMTAAETAYYLEVHARIYQKLAEVL